MFDFRIIDTPDGNQVIDTNLKTPHSALTALQFVEYVKMEEMLAFIALTERRKKREEERKKKKGLLRKLACLCGFAY